VQTAEQLRLTEKGFTQYGNLKNLGLAYFLLFNKDNELKTFSKAHAV
jgi:hypothetical protein